MKASRHMTLNYVSPKARFMGVSKALVAAVEAWAVAKYLREITLESSRTAHRFYVSAGFRDTSPPYAGFGVTMCYPMSKILA